MKMKKSAKGFTLVELMIVVAIIAVLAAIALPAFGQQIRRSRDGAAVGMMSTFRASLSMAVANLEGQAPSTASFNNVIRGGIVTSAGGGTNTNVPMVERWNRIATFQTSSTGNFTAGTPETVNWAYAVNATSAEGQITYSDSALDTRGRNWLTF